jgi:hypothetical protein
MFFRLLGKEVNLLDKDSTNYYPSLKDINVAKLFKFNDGKIEIIDGEISLKRIPKSEKIRMNEKTHTFIEAENGNIICFQPIDNFHFLVWDSDGEILKINHDSLDENDTILNYSHNEEIWEATDISYIQHPDKYYGFDPDKKDPSIENYIFEIPYGHGVIINNFFII